MVKVTAEMLKRAFEESDANQRPVDQAYIDAEELTSAIMDGRFNLEDVARILNQDLDRW